MYLCLFYFFYQSLRDFNVQTFNFLGHHLLFLLLL